MSHHINIFEPFTHKPAHHEDTLTRAFRIPFNQAADLDEQGRLEDTVWQEMQRVASAFDLELPPRAQRMAGPRT